MDMILPLILGICLGAALGYFFRGSEAAAEKARREALEAQLAQLQGVLGQLEDKMKTTFQAAAQGALESSAKQYAAAAEKDMRQVKTEATHELEQRKQAIDGVVRELRDQLRLANERIGLFEKERSEVYARLGEQLNKLHTQEHALIKETLSLKSALTSSNSVRGSWGENTLKNILEESGLRPGIDFEMQFSTANDEGERLRPDVIVHLPNSDQVLAIDAKASIHEGFLQSEKAASEEERVRFHADFVKKLRTRVADLASKEYHRYLPSAGQFVVMFVPSEAAIRAAFDADPELFREATQKRVMLASPSTIIPLIMLIAHARQQYQAFTQARELFEVVGVLGKRLETFVGRLAKVQQGLAAAGKAWNEALEKSWHGQQGVTRALDKARSMGGQLPAGDELSAVEALPVAMPTALEGENENGQDALV